MDVPVTGTEGSPYAKAKSWQTDLNYRHQMSHRHFVGSEEQTDRAADSSEVVNHINLLDLTVRYNISPRMSLSAGIPWFIASRSNPIRDSTRTVIGRSVTHADSPSDTGLTFRRWMRNPDSCKNGNFSLGFGIKAPTGVSDHQDVRTTFANGRLVSATVPVDQSIQPGDGGWGFTLEATGFRRFGRSVGYASGSYLFNPQQENGTDRGGNDPNTRFYSIPDQYLARIGVAMPVWKFISGSIGGRLEGVPSGDAFGGNRGFRRPGYAISVEPGLVFRHGRSALSVDVPVALYRNRTRSFADRANGGHGDAAFADYFLIFGFSRLF